MALPAAVQTSPEPDQISQAFRDARQAQQSWTAISPTERSRLFLRLHDMLLDRREQVLDVLQTETGKARMHANEELLDVLSSVLYYARTAPRLLKPARRPGALPILTRTVEYARPRGVVAVITPWNYPLALSADVVPALLAGNAVVHKPDSHTVRSSLLLRDYAVEAGLDPQLWQVVVGEPDEVGDALTADADYVSFTGSTRAGRGIAQRCADRMIGAGLELGGKNPMLVLADADLDHAVTAGLRACFGNAGQLCIGIERIYVDHSRYPEFLSRLVAATAQLRLGDGLDFTADVGPLISQDQLQRVHQRVQRAVAAGAQVATGGHPRPDIGPCFYQPTVLTGAAPDAEISTEEVFGPVVTVTSVADDGEAIRQANNSAYGLNAAVFSRDRRRAWQVAGQLQTGMVNINEGYAAAYGSAAAPVGGRKQSGHGRRHGTQGLLQYTQSQTVADQRLIGFDPPRGISKRAYAGLLTNGVRMLRRLRLR
jgi:aldehyde dehydrogenase (NAD+)/succinate-semialdehyde dehydrogenase/glutarate-semialdehyde dehydrogenase